jgi:formylglycine-generating enzyme required for sulfatase activity
MRIIKVLIASPSDVGEERKIAESVVHEWHKRNKREGIMLVPVLWELDAAPEMGDRPQGIINRQIVDECECAIGIFWNRIGTDTGVELGGAVEEVKRLEAMGKLVMLYFSRVPIDPDTIDYEQRAKLDQFKKSISPQALTHSFSDRKDFQHELSRHLDLQIPRWFGDPSAQPTGAPKPNHDAELQCYHSTLKEELRWIRMLGLPNIERIDVNLDDDTFVPLRFTRSRELVGDDPERLHSMLEMDNILTPDRVMQEAFKKDRRMLLIIGDPGAGKTTLLKYYALCCLDAERFSRLGFAEPVNVFYLPLRELVKKDGGGYHHLAESLVRWASANQLEIDRKLFDGWLRQGRSLVLLDGLDEIGSVEERKKACRWIEGAWKSYTGARFVVTSRRTGYRKDEGVELEVMHDRADVEDFTKEQQERFLANWFRAAFLRDYNDARLPEAEWQRRQEHRAEERTTKIVAHLREEGNRSLRQLAAIPMILQIMAILWKERDHLPKSRVRLYTAVLDYLLEFRDDRRGIKPLLPAEDARMVLGPVSLWMQEKKSDDAEKGAMLDAMTERLNNLDKPPSAQEFCDYLVDRAGLLMEYGKQNYVFRHKSFREFLAGIELVKKVHRTSGYLDAIIEGFGDDWWDEPLRFFISHGDEELFDLFMDKLFSSDVSDDVLQEKQGFLRTLIEEAPMKKPDSLCEHLMNPENSATRQRVILDCIAVVGKESAIEHLMKFMASNAAKDKDVSERTNEILGHLVQNYHVMTSITVASFVNIVGYSEKNSQIDSSKRLSVDHFGQQVEYILIPSGSYVYSVTEKEIHVPDMHFAKYPVTNRLYRGFIEYLRWNLPAYEAILSVLKFKEILQEIANNKAWDVGFSDYLNEGKNDLAGMFRSRYDEDRNFSGDDHPVVGITLYAAHSYCLWLSLLESKGKYQNIYRLPTEIEWEWAASGMQKRKYPWGNTRPNTKRANYGQNVGATTPVGSYPDGATPEGLYDMAGNVWEWMENWYNESTKSSRALRGGSWNNDTADLRCSSRIYYLPDGGGNLLGFRVVRPSLVLKP